MRFSSLIYIVLGIYLGFCLIGCGDSKDSQKKQSTQEQTQESKAQGQDIARDSASVRELLGLQENSTAFYVLKGKVGDKEQVGYLSIWEDKKRDIDIESSIENIQNDPEKGRVVYLKQNSKDFPLMIAIALPNVWNEAMGDNEHFMSSLDAQKITFSKDEKGFLKVSGVWENDNPRGDRLFWHQKSYFKGEKFSFIQDDTLPLNEVTFAQGHYAHSIKKADKEVVLFESTYKKPIILPSYNPKLESHIVEKLNAQLADGAKDVSELQKQLQYLAKQDFKAYSQEKEQFNAEYAKMYSVEFIDSHIVSLQKFSYVYEGGAHGVHSTTMESYSLQNGERLSSKLEDLFLLDEKNKNTLLQMLTQKLETPEYKEKLFEQTLPLKELPQTFFATSQGIKFVWHIYEIAPYVYGEIEFHIPYNDLKSFVNPSSPYAYLFGLK
ncbi:DUF3298 and DUF4163 domain-containing protein [Helicobacter hepaticus]|jgi:hypothetical protein|uniref:DUF3298 domain-containing protein n=1 Tax=Helicobacter hepaticus (strain ATCC 51449 / 3B1) TaxID=235279 RepID=Q7VFJ2_HELHP|nr:DUF3298 and DUF4163 domain-containing protein [Helicobacter hepaticus]AAP78281.1 hypothetical protein HH_1684 [Helicobacter hepaticus ATCC 51449]